MAQKWTLYVVEWYLYTNMILLLNAEIKLSLLHVKGWVEGKIEQTQALNRTCYDIDHLAYIPFSLNWFQLFNSLC